MRLTAESLVVRRRRYLTVIHKILSLVLGSDKGFFHVIRSNGGFVQHLYILHKFSCFDFAYGRFPPYEGLLGNTNFICICSFQIISSHTL